ncbi:MAG: DUF3524 domain-containing protein [Lentisphaerae bacterium]|nr:DUF3524 domain-containing protein [Lentisphaerota bacterium]MCP4101506.1 DUF3524 domain-containing protein [Lentisphaerota bacterium]
MDKASKLSILALEPFYGGSHRAFLDQMAEKSQHDFTILGLPDKFWRWRTRHAAIHFASELQKPEYTNKKFDLIFCTSMLNLAEFLGLAPARFRNLSTVVYFHENQLVYPIHDPKKRDQHTILVNFKAALAATEIWFNSAYNRDSFLNNLPEFFSSMPDMQPLPEIEVIRAKSKVYPVGINKPLQSGEKTNTIPHILWAARWEHDKNPSDFFKALQVLKKNKIKFKLSVIGENPQRAPHCFKHAQREFADQIENWGYMSSREAYLKVLASADIIVSTAIHEFFGISVVEAVAAGAFPLLPERLAYPEVFELKKHPERKCFFYDGSAENLSEKLKELCKKYKPNKLFEQSQCTPQTLTDSFIWQNLAPTLDTVFSIIA